MTYQWKSGIELYPVTAQKTGETLESIYKKHGELEPETVVEESRPESAPLHPVFEWDDQKAAEKYRVHQAGGLIRAVAVVEQPKNGKPAVEVRAFVYVQHTYTPMHVVKSSVELQEEMLQTALKELNAFRRKYETLKELSPVMDAIAQLSMESQQQNANALM